MCVRFIYERDGTCFNKLLWQILHILGLGKKNFGLDSTTELHYIIFCDNGKVLYLHYPKQKPLAKFLSETKCEKELNYKFNFN